MKRKIVIPQDLKPELLDKLSRPLKDWDIIVGKDPSIWQDHIDSAEILISWKNSFAEQVQKSNTLRWIQSWSAGIDNYPLDYFKKNQILLTTANGVHTNPISETVFALMLSLTRNLHKYIRNQEKKKWFHEYNYLELHNKTIGIVGVGAIGQEVAKIAKAFNMNVLGVRNSGKELDYVDRMYLSSELEEVLPLCDYVVVATPLTPETKHSFTRESFKLMKETAFFINIGRGQLVKEDDLIWALENKEILGAGLDVFEVEPLPESNPLWEMEQVIVTPHTSGSTGYYNERVIEEIFLPNLEIYLKGDKKLPINQVDFSLGY
ncbi:2-hydroxyacid dehydrogenase [Alkalihalobacillus alcalophilus ATCC 27647 = CGMCC 1.3604]|uniref:2-hydroxyacid dehydrogenase n=1 Tax=Alkalihalobacillus alcalophilus ATCC 27647 = CGMCC 1.3604 TaxID=1218173 RepID=A0A094WFP5_ALKAL|nr:D-2-hydroxyacid dehydrogenase [Alkalihalobacillus alcalophilus]KGA95591.1 2-hydroxyacid dehydrogenase [Alkalihalobacillus alcalophilus ATCC 27647 = CGMCC 1.3604]MED1564045.1 D-2-hydroxyacid dehydrogenase [Alkalihalobacillus alcalophilus]THG88749.1 2-hydroxyacid dehydrogenase [Alkalihalobacillus alcalophilus ATCC 27647 = CGMCC 1.3604]